MNNRMGMDEEELLRSVTMMETPAILVVISKGVEFKPKSMATTIRMRDHAMWLSTLRTTPTKETNNAVTCTTT